MWHLGLLRLDRWCHMGLKRWDVPQCYRLCLRTCPQPFDRCCALRYSFPRRPQEKLDGALPDLPTVLNAFLHRAPEVNPDQNP